MSDITSLQTIKEITLDVNKTNTQVVLSKQMDNYSRYIKIKLVDNGEYFDFSNPDYLLFFKAKTSIGGIIDNAVSYDETEPTVVIVPLTQTVLRNPGKVDAELQIADRITKQVLSSFPFIIQVRASAYSDEELQQVAINEYTAIVDALMDVSEISVQEDERKANELVRIANENTRIEHEDTREDQEVDRQMNTAEAIANSEAATADAIDATTDSRTATADSRTATQDSRDVTAEARTVLAQVYSLFKDDNLVHTTQLGIPTTEDAVGVATLDDHGHIPSSQIPGSYDEVLEGYTDEITIGETGAATANTFYEQDRETEMEPESGKIYLDLETNIQFRWSGSMYVSIGSALAIGETATTAFAGNRGVAIERQLVYMSTEDVNAIINGTYVPDVVSGDSNNNDTSGD